MIRDSNSDDPDDEESDENARFGVDIGVGLRTIADILRELDERGQVSGEGRRDGVSFDYSARTGLGPRPGGRDDQTPRPRRKRARVSEEIDAHVDARRDGDELVVTADLPGVDEENLSVGFDGGATELVLGVDGSSVGRVPVPWDAVEVADATFNNGVLVVRVREESP